MTADTERGRSENVCSSSALMFQVMDFCLFLLIQSRKQFNTFGSVETYASHLIPF